MASPCKMARSKEEADSQAQDSAIGREADFMLYQFGAIWGLPSCNPACIKAQARFPP